MCLSQIQHLKTITTSSGWLCVCNLLYWASAVICIIINCGAHVHNVIPLMWSVQIQERWIHIFAPFAAARRSTQIVCRSIEVRDSQTDHSKIHLSCLLQTDGVDFLIKVWKIEKNTDGDKHKTFFYYKQGCLLSDGSFKSTKRDKRNTSLIILTMHKTYQEQFCTFIRLHWQSRTQIVSTHIHSLLLFPNMLSQISNAILEKVTSLKQGNHIKS